MPKCSRGRRLAHTGAERCAGKTPRGWPSGPVASDRVALGPGGLRPAGPQAGWHSGQVALRPGVSPAVAMFSPRSCASRDRKLRRQPPSPSGLSPHCPRARGSVREAGRGQRGAGASCRLGLAPEAGSAGHIQPQCGRWDRRPGATSAERARSLDQGLTLARRVRMAWPNLLGARPVTSGWLLDRAWPHVLRAPRTHVPVSQTKHAPHPGFAFSPPH